MERLYDGWERQLKGLSFVWGGSVWKEYKDVPKGTNTILGIMFICYVLGLVLISFSNA
jgi:glucose uptake protein